MTQQSTVVAVCRDPLWRDYTHWIGPMAHDVMREKEHRLTYFGGVRLCGADVFRYEGRGERHVNRHYRHIQSDHNNDYAMCLPLEGRAEVRQGDKSASVQSGDFILISLSKPFECVVSGASRPEFSCMHVRLSASALRQRLPRIDDYCGREGIAGAAAGRIMKSILGHALSDAVALSPARQLQFNTVLIDCVANAIEAAYEREDVQVSTWGTARGRVFEQARTYIHNNLCDSSLNIGKIARHCRVSSRYLQAAFASFAVTASGYIVEQRLLQCREALRSKLLLDQSISTIAMQWGFNDMPYFCRAYRARFGVTPSADRRAALVISHN